MELWKNHVITAGAGDGLAHLIIDLWTAIQRENRIGHLPVDIRNVFFIEQHTVGGNRETEVLSVLFFQRPSIVYRSFHGIHGHKRLSAEEIHLNVAPGAGTLNDKVDGLFAVSTSMVMRCPGAEVACRGKTVLAPQITVVGHMQAQSLDGCVLLH